jgi:hypothetical protein
VRHAVCPTEGNSIGWPRIVPSLSLSRVIGKTVATFLSLIQCTEKLEAVENGTKQWYIRLTQVAQNLLNLLDFLPGVQNPPLSATILPNAFRPGDYVRLAISA